MYYAWSGVQPALDGSAVNKYILKNNRTGNMRNKYYLQEEEA